MTVGITVEAKNSYNHGPEVDFSVRGLTGNQLARVSEIATSVLGQRYVAGGDDYERPGERFYSSIFQDVAEGKRFVAALAANGILPHESINDAADRIEAEMKKAPTLKPL